MSKLENYLAGERARLKGNLDEAEDHYRVALGEDANDWKLREAVAEVLYAKDDVRGSLKELFQAAHRLIWQGLYEDATRLLQKMLRIDPKCEIDITKGVQSCLDEIAEALQGDADELPADGDWGSTREFLESLVLQDSSSAYRLHEQDLPDKSGETAAPRRELLLTVAGRPPVSMKGKELLIGRARDCHMVFPEGVVSRHHARVVEMDGHYFVHNWESRNGTLHNGRPVAAPTELATGDTITLGHTGPAVAVEVREPAPA